MPQHQNDRQRNNQNRSENSPQDGNREDEDRERPSRDPFANIDRRNVLCVDAEQSARLVIAHTMRGYDVDFALTAEDAEELAACRTYRWCFIDPSLPRLRGATLLHELRAVNPAIAIVVCTRSPAVQDSTISDLGCFAHLRKPVSPIGIYQLRKLYEGE